MTNFMELDFWGSLTSDWDTSICSMRRTACNYNIMAGHPHDKSPLSELERLRAWNHSHPDHPPLTFGHNTFVPPPNDALVGGLSSMTYQNMAVRSNNYLSSSCEFSNYRSANPGPSNNTCFQFSSAGSSSNFQPSHAQSGPSFHPHISADSCIASQIDNRTVGPKRKSPAMPLIANGTNSSGYYSGSSSSHPFSSNHVQPNRIPGPECRPSYPMSIAANNCNDYLVAAEEGFQRNVRSRPNSTSPLPFNPAGFYSSGSMPQLHQSHAFPLEFNPNGAYLSSHVPQQTHSNASTSALRITEQWSCPPVSTPSQGRLPEQWSHTTGSGRTLPSGNNGPPVRDRVYDATQIRNVTVPVTSLHGPSSQGTGTVHSSYAQRTTPHNAIPSGPPLGFAATMPFGVEVVASSRRSRHSTAGHSSSRRNRRVRTAYYGLQSMLDEDNAFGRWASEHFMIMDHSTLTSRELFDQHWDMRLDIDNMSYEELLALEERIGYVNTGLPDETMLRCLTENVYTSDKNQDDQEEEANCIICLDEYKTGVHLGRLNCGHDFHADCIKKWLQMKNACPVCKAAACDDTEGSK
ncbi:uncharacterized protein [Typha angustifolia]|uniref:uncharacterized protein isoform X2 n=1 Tax=Typha angustifolia TaxID=59011 RepID=UPI003C2D63AD